MIAHMEPKWLTIARSKLGTQEVKDNTVIVGWAKQLGGWISRYFTDATKIPWCGLFADYCVTLAGCKTPGDQSLGALNWRGWGQAMSKPGLGSILVFVRPGGGHVGFYVGEDDVAYHVLGGNESNQVEISRELKSRLQAIRWPSESTPQPGIVRVTPTGTPLTTNEA